MKNILEFVKKYPKYNLIKIKVDNFIKAFSNEDLEDIKFVSVEVSCRDTSVIIDSPNEKVFTYLDANGIKRSLNN